MQTRYKMGGYLACLRGAFSAAAMLFGFASLISPPAHAAGEVPEGQTTVTLEQLASRLQVPCVSIPGPPKEISAERMPDFSMWGGPLSFSYLSGAKNTPPFKTEGYCACDRNGVYLAIRCFGTRDKVASSVKVPHDGNVWKGEYLELTLLPAFDTMHEYFHFAVNPAGSLYDAKVNKKAWNSDAKIFTYRDDASWTMVLALTYASLGVMPDEVPTMWRLNLHRYIPSGEKKKPGHDLAWSPTFTTSNHVPPRFGLAFLKGLGRPFDAKKVVRQLDELDRFKLIYKQTFDKDTKPFDAGVLATKQTPEGKERYLRFDEKRNLFLKRNFGPIQGVRMAYAYRCNPDQLSVVLQGVGTVVRDTRPGFSHVWGRGLEAAGCTARSHDGNVVVDDLGLGSYYYKRPYGH